MDGGIPEVEGERVEFLMEGGIPDWWKAEADITR